jgi:hypothetical protein
MGSLDDGEVAAVREDAGGSVPFLRRSALTHCELVTG